MKHRFTPKVPTANARALGDAVYLPAEARGPRHHHEAELIEDEAEAQMRLLHAAAQKQVVVGAYLADARPGQRGPEPVHFREAFRARGPSNHAHGKQAEAQA